MQLKPGTRLFCSGSEAELIVVRPPSSEVTLTCGDVEVCTDASQLNPDATRAAGEGPSLGKRYADEETGLEILCTKGGRGMLRVDGRELLPKGAKPLPASD